MILDTGADAVLPVSLLHLPILFPITGRFSTLSSLCIASSSSLPSFFTSRPLQAGVEENRGKRVAERRLVRKREQEKEKRKEPVCQTVQCSPLCKSSLLSAAHHPICLCCWCSPSSYRVYTCTCLTATTTHQAGTHRVRSGGGEGTRNTFTCERKAVCV